MTAEMNFSDPRFWVDVVQMLAILALWLRRPGEDAGVRITHIEAEIRVINERLQHLPTDDELTQLGGSVRALVSDMEGMRSILTITRESVKRIEDFLLNQK